VTPRLALLVLLASVFLGCGGDEAEKRTLTINAPVEGIVSVGGQNVPVTPYADTQIAVMGRSATISLRTDEWMVTVVGVTSSILNFAPFLGNERLFGRSEETVYFEAMGAEDAVAVTPERVRVPRLEDGRFVVDIPRGESVTLIARWHGADGAQSLGWLRTDDVQQWLGTTLTVSPMAESRGQMAIQTDSGVSGWARAELVVDRLRTGLILAEGRVSSRQARAVPRFEGSKVERFSIWAEVTEGALGGEVAAQASAVLAIDAEEARLPWPAPFTLRPGPREAVEALPLAATEMGWDVLGAEGSTWMEIELTGVGGCSGTRWHVFSPPNGRLTLPSDAPDGLLSSPLIFGRVSAVTVAERDYSDLVGSEGGAVSLLDSLGAPYTAGLWQRRSLSGYWRGDVGTCSGEIVPERYAAYRRGGECLPGDAAPTVLRDRCGAMVTLEGTGAVACTLPSENGLESLSGAEVGLAEGVGTDLVVTQGGRTFDLSPYPRAEAAPPMGWTGRYQRYRVVDQLAYGDETVLGDPLTEPFVVEFGDLGAGPWASLSADGVFEVSTQTAAFSVVLKAFDGTTATGVHVAPACRDVTPPYRLSMERDELVLEVHLPGAEPDQIRRRRMLFSR